MKVRRIKGCIFCHSEEPSSVEFTPDEVIQTCPRCGTELGRAGAFFVDPPSLYPAKVHVEVVS